MTSDWLKLITWKLLISKPNLTGQMILIDQLSRLSSLSLFVVQMYKHALVLK